MEAFSRVLLGAAAIVGSELLALASGEELVVRLLHRHVDCPSGLSLPPNLVAPTKLLLQPHVLPAVAMMLSAELKEDFDSLMRVRLLPLTNRFFSRF